MDKICWWVQSKRTDKMEPRFVKQLVVKSDENVNGNLRVYSGKN